MSGQTEILYKVQKKDIPKAGAALADAFHLDSVWRLFFRDEATIDQRGTLFEAPIKYCFKYGEVYATSEQLEGIAAWVLGDRADLTIWRMIRSGAISSGLKAMRVCTKLAQKQGRIFKPLEVDRRANMMGRDYIYLMIIGVASEFQGQGYGRKLLEALIGESEQAGIPIYTETQTEENVRFYERLGFRPIKQITLPIINLPQWELLREPEA
jgi:ribosomal protein S18 acetylase RimI-like enzyme